tara:strand:+ start:49 stop:315 length:267 start_codon:yes stop_codon:yes gene_type:complete
LISTPVIQERGFKYSENVSNDQKSRDKQDADCLSGVRGQVTFKRESDSGVEPILPTKLLEECVCVNTVVEYSSHQEEEPSEHDSQKVV